MENKNTFILHETEAFMRGELDNVTVAHGRIVLDLVSGGHVPYGCYTSPAVPLPTFDALRVSWNAASRPSFHSLTCRRCSSSASLKSRSRRKRGLTSCAF